VDAALAGAATVLRATAAAFDAHTQENAACATLRARAVAEAAVECVIRHTGRALGAAPFCRDPHFARMMADLPVFVRQSHAERDLEVLGTALAQQEQPAWRL
jgi:hypothetical protein